MYKKTIYALGVAMALGVSAASQAAFISFDVDGGGSTAAVQATGFDWEPGNILLQNAFPVGDPVEPGEIPGTPKDFTMYGHGHLGTMLGGSAQTAADGTEITYVFRADMTHEAILQGSTSASYNMISATGGFLDIYFDDHADASIANQDGDHDDITGLGYDDGLLIFTGHFVLGGETLFGGLQINDITDEGLDQTGAKGDNDNGVMTEKVTGSIDFNVEVDWFHTDFFKDDIEDTLSFDVEVNSELLAAFKTAEPSDAFYSVSDGLYATGPTESPNFGDNVNDNSCANVNIDECDVQVQSDASTTWLHGSQFAPEPGPLALLGIGLLGMGAARRQRRNRS